MTVRAWFTISAVALGALAIAFVAWVLIPKNAANAPDLLAAAGPVRLDGQARGSCWPQPRAGLRCTPDSKRKLQTGKQVSANGTLRVVADFPIQPKDGTLTVGRTTGGDPVLQQDWDDKLPYTLERGRYVLHAEARYPGGGYVRYDFPFTVR